MDLLQYSNELMTFSFPAWSEMAKALKSLPRDEGPSCISSKKYYRQQIEKQANLFPGFAVKFTAFLGWLDSQGLKELPNSIAHGAKAQLYLQPMCGPAQPGGIFTFETFDATDPKWTMLLPFRVQDPIPFQEEETVVFHEFGHFVFQGLLGRVLPKPISEEDDINLYLPIVEGFADWVSYEFLGKWVCADPTRQILNTSTEERHQVISGKHEYLGFDLHQTSAAFRDVLIDLSAKEGPGSSVAAMNRILRNLVAEGYEPGQKISGRSAMINRAVGDAFLPLPGADQNSRK